MSSGDITSDEHELAKTASVEQSRYRFTGAPVLLLLTIHSAFMLRSFLAVSHPVNQDVLGTLGWILNSRAPFRVAPEFDFTSGLGVPTPWFSFVGDPIALVLRLAPGPETFYWYKLSSIVVLMIVTYTFARTVASPWVAQVAATGLVVFVMLPSRFAYMFNIDFGGPGFPMMVAGWLMQLLFALLYISKNLPKSFLFGFGGLTVWTLIVAHVWQPMYVYLALISGCVLLVNAFGSQTRRSKIIRLGYLAVSWFVAATTHILVMGSYVPFTAFSARRVSNMVESARPFSFTGLMADFAGEGLITPIVAGLALVGWKLGSRDSNGLTRLFVSFWLLWSLFLVAYSALYSPLRSRGVELGNTPNYFMQASAPLNWIIAAYATHHIVRTLVRSRKRLSRILMISPLIAAVIIPVFWNIKNVGSRSSAIWPDVATPSRVFSRLTSVFPEYEIPYSARVAVIQNETTFLSSFDELFRDFSDIRRTDGQALFNLYSGFVRPWSAEFTNTFVFDGVLRNSSITATKASPVAFELLGIDHVISREPIAIAGARRVAERPDGVGLYRLASGNRWFADAYEVKPNLAEHVAVLQAQETAAESWSGGRLRAVLYESIGQIVQPTTSKVRIEREKVTVSGTTSGTSLLTLPIEFSTCNRWKSLSGDDIRPVAVNGFFQGYVVSGEFAGEITRNTRGLGQVVCETRDYMRWRSINEEN